MPSAVIRPDRRAAYDAATSFQDFLAGVQMNEDLWRSLARRAAVPGGLIARARAAAGRWHLLVLLEDWCGDAVNAVPVLARLVEQLPHLTLRVLKRDEHPDLMDAHLTDGKRAIPIVIVLNEEFREIAWWGPRPADLQDWVTSLGMSLSKPDRYREMRRWYAVDRGRSIVEEIVQLLCESAEAPCGREAA